MEKNLTEKSQAVTEMLVKSAQVFFMKTTLQENNPQTNGCPGR